MVTHPVGDGLNEHGPLLLDDDLPRLLAGHVYREYVVAVNSDGGHAIGDTPHRDAISRILVINGRRNGVHVVPAEEQCLAPQSGREVHG